MRIIAYIPAIVNGKHVLMDQFAADNHTELSDKLKSMDKADEKIKATTECLVITDGIMSVVNFKDLITG